MKLESIVFYPIPTRLFLEILENPGKRSFQVDPQVSYPGQLFFDTSIGSLVGAGGFKTAHSAQLVLTPPAPSGLGSLPRHDVIMKRPYDNLGSTPQSNSTNGTGRKFNRYAFCEEVEKLFKEANLLYWAKSLLQMTYNFIDHTIARSSTHPPFKVPRLRFVEAGLALAYTQAPAENTAVQSSSSTRMTGAYLLEERIANDRGEFTKFIHNNSCIPLLLSGEDNYDIAEFLAFTQHVQYVKTKGLAYITDYQGLCPSIPFSVFCLLQYQGTDAY